MSVAEVQTAKTMTVDEFLALPEDGISRELIRGKVRVRGVDRECGMTYRNFVHSWVEANIVFRLKLWLEQQPQPRGRIVCGEAGFRLPGGSVVGIDVAYASPELVAASGKKPGILNGPPVLAVEVLSPSDTHEDVVEKLELYREAGVVVWVVDPDLRLVQVHQPGQEPLAFNVHDELSGEPYLPGLRVAVAEFFAD